jgi:hypothetical protein
VAFRQDTRNVHYVACSAPKCDFGAENAQNLNMGEYSRFRMEKKVVKMEKFLVKNGIVVKIEEIIAILENIIVTIRYIYASS